MNKYVYVLEDEFYTDMFSTDGESDTTIIGIFQDIDKAKTVLRKIINRYKRDVKKDGVNINLEYTNLNKIGDIVYLHRVAGIDEYLSDHIYTVSIVEKRIY